MSDEGKEVLATTDSRTWGRGQRCRGLDEQERPDCGRTHLQRVGRVEDTWGEGLTHEPLYRWNGE